MTLDPSTYEFLHTLICEVQSLSGQVDDDSEYAEEALAVLERAATELLAVLDRAEGDRLLDEEAADAGSDEDAS